MSDQLLNQLLKGNLHDEIEQLPEYQKASFTFQIECLKLEIDLIDRHISRRETITQNVKNFAVVGWAASITLFLGQTDLRKYVIITAILPLIFWLVDAWWIYLYRGSRLRLKKIHEFINSSDLLESFKLQKLVNFQILDISGRQYKGTKEYEKNRNIMRIIRFREMVYLYGGLTLFSLIVGVVALWIF